MKFKNFPYFITAIILLLTFNSCSDNSDDTDIPEAANLLVGEWLLISEGTYFCGTEDVDTSGLADLDDVFVFNEDGTWGDYNNGTYEDDATEYSQRGTWGHIDGNNYEVYWAEDDLTETTVIEFEGNNTMKYGISDCWEITDGTSIYEYNVMTRQ